MALDGIVTRAIAAELQGCVGARIHKIHQPSPRDLVLQIRGNGAQGKLLLSANPTYPRVHWTQQTYTNPKEAPMFCMLLRKYCEGGIIEQVKQVDNERILHLTIRRRDELGDIMLRTLVIELMGRHSNIMLIDQDSGLIHDGIHHVTPAISSYRTVMPGSAYMPPPDQRKANPLLVTSADSLVTLLAGADHEPQLQLQQRIVDVFSGVSPLLARELVYRSGLDTEVEADAIATRLWPVFDSMMEDFREHRYAPVITEDSRGRSQFAVTALTHLGDSSTTTFENVSSCLEAYYGGKAQRDTVKQRVSDLLRFLSNEKSKNVKKLEKLADTIEEAKDADKYRVLGELITTYMHQIKKGDEFAEVVNYYDEAGGEVKIQLDPQLSPSENAQRYFKRYNKSKNSLSMATGQMESAREEIHYLESLLQQLDSASLADIEEIREELIEQQYLRDRSKRGQKKKKPTRPALLSYTSSEGISILVGKNNTQNEYLTNRLASSSDTWLHTKDIPGSHVVIRSTSFGEPTLEEAAMLAAHYSQARASSQVPVDYTLIRHVRKPNGAKPGYVIYEQQKTLFVTPDEQRLQTLPVTTVT
ncbi:Rqc2 family fibronectin-binding protein [Paenibacillus daejeonensis]|uniref:Rqc2 family fibronectin-binding protein n=1 Tax=Paenibacillus daejeonensis TaxID=135193 RepID=UPI00036D3768|nr:NFACT RNA binding domain-containing protein [Paenibacillus daejeonensis]